jgi:eukaryotic-like serine/threonine-protein kinase
MLGGRYRLGPEIASGGMGSVHRAWDERFAREVAIKVLRSGADRVEQERLRREAQYLARLDHPNLVAVLDAGADRLRSGDTVWFAMELVAGPDLRSLLKGDGPLDGPTLRRILVGLLAALGALHDAGLVHRDLKPANVLLTAEPWTGRWDVKLVDLGIAQHARTEHLTSTGQIVGTAAYLSPEQVSGGEIGPATDVYALGLLAVEALTGRIAFPGGPAETAAARLVRAPELPPALDPAWRAVLSAMTALDPAARPGVEDLAARVAGLPDALTSDAAAEVPTELIAVAETTRRLPAPDATTVLPQEGATQVLPQEAATTVLPAEAPPTGRRAATPARRKALPMRRRHLLVAASLLLVLGAAGGWVAALSGGHGSTAEAVPPAAPAVHATTTPSATPTPTATATPTATPTPTVAAVSAEDVRKAQEAAQKAAEEQAKQTREQAKKAWQEWRDRWKHHG